MTATGRICSRCVMDTSDPEIVFDAGGVCNHCHRFLTTEKHYRRPEAVLQAELEAAVAAIRRRGRGHRYDCVLGLSGGADSSYLAWLAAHYRLRPLLVHMDNSWDSELAVKNVENIIHSTGFDYFNLVIDWPEFRDLQTAYFRASVIDLEVPTDHAILALLYRVAREQRVSTILQGANFFTESVMPAAWQFDKSDLANLLAIHRRFGTRPLVTYPRLSLFQRRWLQAVHEIRLEPLLTYCRYRRQEVERCLREAFRWQNPGGKHTESIFTRFYQDFILPRKFGVDKRRAHLSNLVLADEMSREEALELLAVPPGDPAQIRADYDYVIKKWNMTAAEFEEVMALPPVPHLAFASDQLTRAQRLCLLPFQVVSAVSRRLAKALPPQQ